MEKTEVGDENILIKFDPLWKSMKIISNLNPMLPLKNSLRNKYKKQILTQMKNSTYNIR